MKHLKDILLTLILSLLSLVSSYAQELNKDSLKTLLKNEQNDSIKVILYTDVSWEYCYSNTDSALYYAEKSVELANTTDNLLCQSKAISQRATSYYVRSQFELALTDYLTGLKFDEQLNDSLGIGADLISIGNIYSGLNKLDLAMEYYKKSHSIYVLLKDTLGISDLLGNMGAVYIQKKEYDKAQKVLEEVLFLIKNENNKASTYQNLGAIYKKTGNYTKSMVNLKLALNLFEKTNRISNIANICSTISGTLVLLKKPKEAIVYANRALKLSKELGSLDLMQRAYFSLSQAHVELNKYKEAYDFRLKYTKIRDSIFNENSDKSITEIETKYQTEKKDKENELLKKDIELEKLANERSQITSLAVGFSLFLVIVFSVIIYRRLNITREQKIVIEETNEELNQTNEELATQRDEIEKQKEVVEEAHNDIKASINYAKRIQNAILPASSLINEYLPESFVLYKPKDVVAGDFYWMESVKNKVLFAAADCTGHGVPGAMVSVVCHNAMNRAVREFGLTEPGVILDKTREIVVAEFEKSEDDVKDGMDIALCSIDGNKLQYAGAHNPLWIIRGNEILETKADKQPIGKFDDAKPFTTHSLELQKGDSVYLLTDGYADQFGGEKDKKFGNKQFKELLLSNRDKTMEQQKEVLDSTFQSWMKQSGAEQVDDVCIIGIKL